MCYSSTLHILSLLDLSHSKRSICSPLRSQFLLFSKSFLFNVILRLDFFLMCKVFDVFFGRMYFLWVWNSYLMHLLQLYFDCNTAMNLLPFCFHFLIIASTFFNLTLLFNLKCSFKQPLGGVFLSFLTTILNIVFYRKI